MLVRDRRPPAPLRWTRLRHGGIQLRHTAQPRAPGALDRGGTHEAHRGEAELRILQQEFLQIGGVPACTDDDDQVG